MKLSSFSEKKNKIDETSPDSSRKKRRAHVNKIRNEKGEATNNTAEIQMIIRDYCKQLYASKVDNLEEMDKSPEIYNLLRLNQEEIENMNRTTTSNKIELIILKISNKQKSRTR